MHIWSREWTSTRKILSSKCFCRIWEAMAFVTWLHVAKVGSNDQNMHCLDLPGIDCFEDSCLMIINVLSRETLKEVLPMLRSTGNPQVEYIIRILKKWAKDNRVAISFQGSWIFRKSKAEKSCQGNDYVMQLLLQVESTISQTCKCSIPRWIYHVINYFNGVLQWVQCWNMVNTVI